MAQVVNVARDSFGNVIPEAEVTVFIADTDTLATIFSDNNNTLSKPNPFNADDQGQYSFFADPGEVKIQVEKQGFETFVIDFIPVAVVDFSTLQEGAGIAYGGPNIVIPIGTPTQVIFDTLIYDDASMVTLPNIVLNRNGMYHISASIVLDSIGTTASHTSMVTQASGITLDSGFGTNISFSTAGIYRGTASDNITLTITPQGGQAEVISGTPFLQVAMIYPL